MSEGNLKLNIKAFSREERRRIFKEMGLPAYRETQLFSRICKGALGFDDCREFSLKLREDLKERFSWDGARVELVQKSSDGTMKFLLVMPGGDKCEAVLMRYSYGNTLCISTQVGCRMGCSFCASTLGGLKRQLAGWEMLDELIACGMHSGLEISRVVLMGSGEPFDNYDELCNFLRLVHDPDAFNLSYRNITVSTCGLIPQMERFAEDFPQVNLAVSLHAASQEEREVIMPIAKAYPLSDLLKACRLHAERTGRRVSYEFALIEGKNDDEGTAKRLAALLKGSLCHVNLIPLNPVEESGLAGSGRKAALHFKSILEDEGIAVTLRRSLGRDIDAACGQLRNKYI